MDHVPIFVDESFREWNVSEIESDPDPQTNDLIDKALLLDDAPAFVELINNLPSPIPEEDSSWICGGVFHWNSAKCAAAIIDGQITNHLPRATARLSSIHYAVGTKAYNIVSLMLQRGFSADVRGDFNGHHLLPLHALLLPKCIWVTGKLSAARGIVELCSQPRRDILETLRMIALNTTEIKREFFNYLKEGKILPVVALLLVAKSSILSPSTVNGEGEFRNISEIRDFVVVNSKNNNNLVEMMEERLVFVEMLEILDKIGDKITTLIRLDFTQTCLTHCSTLLLASVIEDAGFDVKDAAIHCESNLSDIRSEVESKLLKRGIEECEKRICSTDTFPSWVKQAALRGLRDESDSTTHLTYPFLAKALPYMDSVSVSPLTPENMTMTTPLHHLLNMTVPFWGKIKQVFRRGILPR